MKFLADCKQCKHDVIVCIVTSIVTSCDSLCIGSTQPTAWTVALGTLCNIQSAATQKHWPFATCNKRHVAAVEVAEGIGGKRLSAYAAECKGLPLVLQLCVLAREKTACCVFNLQLGSGALEQAHQAVCLVIAALLVMWAPTAQVCPCLLQQCIADYSMAGFAGPASLALDLTIWQRSQLIYCLALG